MTLLAGAVPRGRRSAEMGHPEGGESEDARLNHTYGEVERVTSPILRLRETGVLCGNCKNVDASYLKEL